ncbi:MAG: helix-turn-helix transcriptional regulator [Peptococcaceae bacterium]|nr:helix-turn-helix transcriptional regulator [Peptococcaceae bacterium]
MDSIGERIKFLRKSKGLTIQELANVIEKSKSNISGYENGAFEPSAQTIIKLCSYFSISADWLLYGKTSSESLLRDDEKDLIGLYNQLPQKDKFEVLEIIKIKLGHPKGRLYTSKTGKSGPENPDDSSVTA